MYQVVRFSCDQCGREHYTATSAEACEGQCRRLRAEREAAIAAEKHWHDAGHDTWPENGKLCHAPRVDPKIFGPHAYVNGDGTGTCGNRCGCWMGSANSGGPVYPFGACPKNPRSAAGDGSECAT